MVIPSDAQAAERDANEAAPREQPPPKLSGKKVRGSMTLSKVVVRFDVSTHRRWHGVDLLPFLEGQTLNLSALTTEGVKPALADAWVSRGGRA